MPTPQTKQTKQEHAPSLLETVRRLLGKPTKSDKRKAAAKRKQDMLQHGEEEMKRIQERLAVEQQFGVRRGPRGGKKP